MKHLNEFDFPELDCSEESGYCMTSSTLQFVNPHRAKDGKQPLTKCYMHWEDNVALPYFRSKGYEVKGRWHSVEADSFGPLIRGVRLIKDDVTYLFTYG